MNKIKLENLLERAAKDPACRTDFYEKLMISDLIVLYHPNSNDELQNGFVQLKKDTPVKIKEFLSNDGRHVIPIFTSIEALEKGIKTEEAYLQFNARILFELTKGASYILNPYSDYAKEFTAKEVEGLLNNKITQSTIHVIEKDTKALISQPKNYPNQLVKALRRYFSKTNIVQAAYLVQIFIPNKDEVPHLLVGIRMPLHDAVILKNAMIISQSFLKKNDLIDFVVVKENDELIKGIIPFFKNTILNRIKNILFTYA